MAGYDPRSRPPKDDKPRYRDDDDDDYPDSRKARRSRYDDEPPYAGAKNPKRDIRPEPEMKARGKGAPSDDDLDDDKYARPGPRGGARGREPESILLNQPGRPRASSRGGSKQHIELRDNDSSVHDVERKTSKANKDFRNRRDGYESDEGETLKTRKPGKGPQGKGFDGGDDPFAAGALPRRGTNEPDRRREPPYGEPRRRATDLDDAAAAPRRKPKDRDDYDDEPPRRRPKDRDPYDNEPPRRKEKDRGGDRDRDRDQDRRRRDPRYDDDSDDTRSRRRRDDDDRRHRSEDRGAKKYRDDDRDRGYRSDGRSKKYRDDDSDSDRGPRRSESRRYKDDRREKDKHRDRDRYDSDRDRGSRDRKKKSGFRAEDIGKYVQTGQKHYKTVAPIVQSLAKMYMDSKK